MNTELRPLSVGEILDRTAQLYRSRFLLFAGISAFPAAVPLIVGLATVVLTRYVLPGRANQNAAIFVTVAGVVLGALIYAMLLGVSLAANNRAVSDLYLDQPASIGSAYRQVKPHWFRYIWLMFVATLYAWAPAVFLFAAAVGVAMVPALSPGVTAAGAMALVPAGSLFLFLPLGIWMTLRYSLAVPASIFEDLRIHASLKRSVFLTKKGRGRIFVMLLLVFVIAIVLNIAVEIPFMIVTSLFGQASPTVALVALIANQLGSFAVNSLLAPVYGIAITLFYYDARIRKEGFDIEWMMQRANLSADRQPRAIDPDAFSSTPISPATEAGTL
jgi:hypothetical protein